MVITKIEKQKNNLKKYSIFIDYEFAFRIDEVDLLYYNLKENEHIKKEKYDNILKNILLKQAKDKALKYLSYKMRSEKQVRDKLIQNQFPSNVINKVINILKKYNYINDEEFAKTFIKNKMNIKGYGSFKISYDLKLQGINEEVFKKYLYDENFVNEEKEAIILLKKKIKNIPNIKNIDYKEKQKLYAYLSRRGFSYNTINNVFKKILEDKYI